MRREEKEFVLQNVFPEIIAGIDEVEQDGEKQKSWVSKDEKFLVTVSVIGGGKEWKGMWIKEVGLATTNEAVGSDLMKVQFTRGVNNEVVISVFIEVLKVDLKNWYFATYSYTSDNGGKKELMDASRYPNENGKMIMEDCIDAVANEPVRFESDLPEKIDIEETVRLFMEQLEDRNLMMPALIKI